MCQISLVVREVVTILMLMSEINNISSCLERLPDISLNLLAILFCERSIVRGNNEACAFVPESAIGI